MNRKFSSKQSGMVLVVSMLILISLTVLGLMSMQSSRTELSMAGNQREIGITFNAAEAGLSSGEDFINNSISKTIYSDPTQGLYNRLDIDPDYQDPTTWNAAQTAAIALPDVAAQPSFIIKYLGDRSQNEVAAVNIGGYGSSQPGMTVSNFRITSRAVGQTGRATRQLQSYYGKQF